LGSARDRRGAEQTRRFAPGPEPWQPEVALIARFFAAQPQKMRPNIRYAESAKPAAWTRRGLDVFS
jgi:hypothetical protein